MTWFQTVLLDITNIYSIDEGEKPSLLFYLKYIVLQELIHSPTPCYTEKQILLLQFKKNT